MGFYGNIKNTSRTQFSFDKVYANRVEMDTMASLDGIYAGRFVLIEYDTAATPAFYPAGYLKDGIVYTAIPNTANGTVYPYQICPEDSTENTSYYITSGTLIRVAPENNFDQTFYNADGTESEIPLDVYFFASGSTLSKTVPKYYYDPNNNTLAEAKDEDGNILSQELSYAEMKVFNEQGTVDIVHTYTSYDNYIRNYNIDRVQYGVSRGYDSTVWQKVYEKSAAKYVMVAELNSVIPTFDLAADSPTMTPILPHFDVDSTNVYYKLHMQPQWGIRIKGSDPDQETPRLTSSGEAIPSSYIPARKDSKEYPSDATTTWINQTYNFNSGETSDRVFIKDDGNGNPDWVKVGDERDSQEQIPAAIYFNKAGFDPEKVSYSFDKEYRDWNVSENTEFKYLVTDEITLSPSGQSGHSYSVHGQKGIKDTAPDIQELAIMLPSIGDSMASIWDLIYGGRNVDPDAKERNLDVSWYNAKAVSNKKGLRLINTVGPGRYTYNPKAASTVAGILNSAQDLMGMIITDEIPTDESSANGDYIYYNQETQKYYFKHKTFEYAEKIFENNRIPDDYDPYEPVSLRAWDKSCFYIDTATTAGWEFVMEDKFYPDRKYIQTGYIDNAMEPISLSAEYKPNGTFFLRGTDVYDGGSSYNYFVASYELFNPDHKYYELIPSETQLRENEAIYIPNTYYYIDYEYVELTPTTYEPGVYYFQWGLNNLGYTEYRLATEEDMTAHRDGMGNPVTAFYKRRYILDTSLKKQNHVYYRVIPNGDQTSNAYYKQNKYAIAQPEMTYEMYSPNSYYYIGTKEDIELGVYQYELINGVYYIKDTTSYNSEDAFKNAGHEYFSIKIEYELVQGEDVIEITDENAVKVEYMRDLTEFQAGDIDLGVGTDVFYTFVDSEGATRYIEVNYNNFNKAYNPITQNYALIVMDFKTVGKPYHTNGYYYKVTDEANPKFGSYLIDNSSKITANRQYYEFVPVEGFDYSGEYLTDYYSEGSYYIEYPKGSGQYIPADSEFDPDKEYLDPSLILYVKEDAEGIYDIGAEWPMEVKQIPEGVTLATREDIWEFKELPSFGDKLITLHGMLLKLYRHLDETDDLTRDTTTARGSINQFNDLMHRFSELVPGQFTIVDDYGRMHSAELSTAQELTFDKTTDADAQTIAGTKPAEENALITIQIDSNFRKPTISITHSDANYIDDTTSAADMNIIAEKNVLTLETPLVDNAGHIVGRNRHSVTLPFGFKFITPQNSDAVTGLITNEVQIKADNTQDTVIIASQNKWIKVASEGNTFKFAHEIVRDGFGEQKNNNQDATPKFGGTFNVPVITVDNAGHITAFDTETVRIPGLELEDDSDNTNDVVINMSYRYDVDKDTGIFTEERAHVDNLIIQDYSIDGVANAKLANTDSIHGAFAKLQVQIDAMDLIQVGGTEEDYIYSIAEEDGVVTAKTQKLPSHDDVAVVGEFVSQVSEKFGKISVTRVALDPSITIVDGTEDLAPTVNVTVNEKSGIAQSLTIATVDRYGVTKLTSEYSSINADLALNGVALKAAIEGLKQDGLIAISADQTIKSWKEENGIVSIEIQDILIRNSNIADDAAIAMDKIDGLSNAISNASAEVLGNADSAEDSMTVYGLSKRLDAIIGDSNSTSDSMTIYGLSSKIDDVIGTESDNSSQKTIYGLLAKIAELEARITELHPVTPTEGDGGEVGL